mmetsp:Transcript_15424/g.22719  ORF Transcript_15424/g.22719 Transcript_15424/m.22719 type:complete len:231 (-) Transcript_15424:136-828(-)|eukprot:CAMPEP_0195530022 /NCGR_PEP_ID=MMETSP0794_2-20130614/32727_1 /TAXON_ID=515487 /ORGANISM="Stephanopyxis turris, Strain CCMP 815" /LENGTH=230 /DNA_ID=CAMNT_0040661419 /DNA_START=151 /DNA_END=843 /DNA_ORIENTATION=+
MTLATLLSFTALLSCASSFGMVSPLSMKATSNSPLDATISRRDSFQKASALIGVAGSTFLSSPAPSFAEVSEETARVTTRMGGLLEKYQDGPRGFVILAPSGWNKFEGEVGAYDVKWQDLVDPKDNVKISSTPVKSTTTSIDVLGDVKVVGEGLATKRNAKLLSAEERLTDGVLFYKFDFAINDGTHQLLQLCVNKGKVWSLDANSSEKRWSKRSEMYENILGSFIPKLV